MKNIWSYVPMQITICISKMHNIFKKTLTNQLFFSKLWKEVSEENNLINSLGCHNKLTIS